MRFAVLLTVHNRRETTLRCLDRLFAQELPPGTTFTVFLVDDGCTDGTPEAIRERFPQVTIIPGDGSLFWNQGMRLAWKTAAEAADWDAYLWLNDDTMLLPGALTTMLETLAAQEAEMGKRGIVVGSCRKPRSEEQGAKSVGHGARSKENPQKPAAPCPQPPAPCPLPPASCSLPPAPCPLPPDKLTYGGQLAGRLVHPAAHPQPIDRFNGNLVLVSREAHAVLGNLSGSYRHSFGDIDYGIRARRKGLSIWLAPGFQGECPRNPPPKWRNPEFSILQRWKAVCGPKGWTVKEVKAFSRARGQRFWLLSLLRQATMVCFPGYARRRQKRFDKPI